MYTMTKVPTMLKIREAAKAFNVTERVLRTAIQKGDLPAYHPNCRTFLLKAGDVLEWVEKSKYAPQMPASARALV